MRKSKFITVAEGEVRVRVARAADVVLRAQGAELSAWDLAAPLAVTGATRCRTCTSSC